MSECVLLVDDDLDVTGALAQLLERPGRTVVICSDVESAELTLARYPVTHLVTDVQFSGQFGFEGLHFLSRVRTHRPDCRIVLMTGFATEALCNEALRNGATAVLAKPFETCELEAALGPAAEAGDEPSQLVQVRSIEAILRDDALRAVFQPIVRLGDESTFGFEALARVHDGWAAGGPAELFTYASRCSRLAELNLGAAGCAIREARHLPLDATLFLNIDPCAIETASFPDSFRAVVAKTGIALDRIVIEITERSGFSNEPRAAEVFSDLRGSGIRFALDDVGSAWSHLGLMSRIQPSFIKISGMFGTDAEQDETKRRIVRNVLALARDFDCRTILEGIETRDTAQAAVDLEIDYGQGFLFGRPHPAHSWTNHWSRACA